MAKTTSKTTKKSGSKSKGDGKASKAKAKAARSDSKKASTKASKKSSKKAAKIGSKKTKRGTLKKDAIPSTLLRSDEHAQEIFAETHDSAAATYSDEQPANRVAWAAVKHSYEKVGDHWEPKDEKGPSDDRAAGGLGTDRPTAGGVDANATKQHLLEVARRLEIRGRTTMTKDALVDAIQKANNRETAKARQR